MSTRDIDSSVPVDSLISAENGRRYWNSVESDENGMLGGIPSVAGFSRISPIDLQGSRNFLAKLGIGNKDGLRTVGNALEGGAGVGRITEGLLVTLTDQVDVIEPVAKFTAALNGKRGVRKILNIGLEEWQPAEGDRYDLVWIQWCIGHLTDDQLVRFLERCKSVLTDGGVIVLKENMSTIGMDVFDDQDSSVTRQDETFRCLFKRAGLNLVKTELQKGFPKTSEMQLLPVRMYALKAFI